MDGLLAQLQQMTQSELSRKAAEEQARVASMCREWRRGWIEQMKSAAAQGMDWVILSWHNNRDSAFELRALVELLLIQGFTATWLCKESISVRVWWYAKTPTKQ